MINVQELTRNFMIIPSPGKPSSFNDGCLAKCDYRQKCNCMRSLRMVLLCCVLIGMGCQNHPASSPSVLPSRADNRIEPTLDEIKSRIESGMKVDDAVDFLANLGYISRFESKSTYRHPERMPGIMKTKTRTIEDATCFLCVRTIRSGLVTTSLAVAIILDPSDNSVIKEVLVSRESVGP